MKPLGSGIHPRIAIQQPPAANKVQIRTPLLTGEALTHHCGEYGIGVGGQIKLETSHANYRFWDVLSPAELEDPYILDVIAGGLRREIQRVPKTFKIAEAAYGKYEHIEDGEHFFATAAIQRQRGSSSMKKPATANERLAPSFQMALSEMRPSSTFTVVKYIVQRQAS